MAHENANAKLSHLSPDMFHEHNGTLTIKNAELSKLIDSKLREAAARPKVGGDAKIDVDVNVRI